MPQKLQKHTRNEKEKNKKKIKKNKKIKKEPGGRKQAQKKKAKVGFCRKKKKRLFDGRDLFDSNVFNNQARSLHMSKFVKTW